MARKAKLNKLQWIFSADATEETKICHDKIYTLIFSGKFLFGLPLRIGP